VSAGPLVSVIVPTFDEEAALPGVLEHVAALDGEWEVIVADGASRDRTVEIARAHGARVVSRGATRAAQLNAAAADAGGELFLFLHADSRLPAGAWASLASVAPGVGGGNFALRFSGGDLFARVLTAAYALQRRFGFYYGDSSIWVRRSTFEALGGYREIPIMDDYDFVRRLEEGFTTARLPGPALTSPRRWRALGVPRTLLSWWTIRRLYVAGVPAKRLAGLYRRVR
jgi:rSAM/selenodomain-associated transferase 2